MEGKVKIMVVLLPMVMFSTFDGFFSQASLHPSPKKSTQSTAVNRFGSTAVFPVTGNVYPRGYYSVSLKIGNPPKLYDLDIDTGSDLTWVQCDAPCTGCTVPRDSLYNPKNNLVACKDPICSAFHLTQNHQCEANDQCDYEVLYADHGSSLGVLVTDHFPLRLTNGSLLAPRLTFGCGYDQSNTGPIPPPTAGVLGLGNGKASILSQLQSLGLTRNVLGHCLSASGGGYLFLGDDLVPSSGIVWTPMSQDSPEKHYSSGPAELLFGGKATGVKGLQIIFDSGSSYTYFNSQAYKTTLDLIRKGLKGKPLKDTAEDKALPVCWKGTKPFQSVQDVIENFKPLSFIKTKNVQLQIPPEAYLIVTEQGSVCLGVLNGTEAQLGSFNVIGDISLQDKIVIYDNEKQRIGWGSSNCNKLPNVDRDYNDDFWQLCVADFGNLDENYQVTAENINRHGSKKKL